MAGRKRKKSWEGIIIAGIIFIVLLLALIFVKLKGRKAEDPSENDYSLTLIGEKDSAKELPDGKDSFIDAKDPAGRLLSENGDSSETDGSSVTDGSSLTDVTSGTDGSSESGSGNSKLTKSDDEELINFFKNYFSLRLQYDTDALSEIIMDNNRSPEEIKTLREHLKTESGYIEEYKDLELFECPFDIDSDKRLFFIKYKIKFRRTDTEAPGIFYCLLDRENMKIYEKPSPDEIKYINNLSQDPQIKSLISTCESDLLQAITSDSRLMVIYDAFIKGKIYTEDMTEIDSIVKLMEED